MSDSVIDKLPLELNELLSAADSGDDDASAAIAIAKTLLQRSRALQTPQERRQQAELDRMIRHPDDKATLVEMTDQAFRSHSPARVADQLTHILDVQGVPRFFSPLEQTMLRGFQTFGGYLPGVAVPLVKDKMRQETANVILPAEEQPLREHLSARQESGLLMNVNFLGEALLGEHEANRRLQHYLHALQIPEIACISVKLSTIFSQVSTVARAATVATVSDRLELLYRAANRADFQRPDGISQSKFVYLDMEEYRDLHLTADTFRNTLDRPGLELTRAGIALQAYIPDSDRVLRELIDWSTERVRRGGLPITVRLVKGANMEMERVEASIGGWPTTPYTTKLQTDANFKRMLRSMIDAAAQGALRVAVASHNLFDIALALLWGSRSRFESSHSISGATGTVLDAMQFEMLEGMANHQRRALCEAAPRMLLYAPACRREDFLNAIGYLIRRLDENTGRENFLRYSFQLQPDSEIWNQLAVGFRDSYSLIDQVSNAPRRTQDRRLPALQPPAADHWSRYSNDPDTDWSLPQHSEWASSIVQSWQQRTDADAEAIPLLIGGQDRDAGPSPPDADGPVAEEMQDGCVRRRVESPDPSRPEKVACRFVQATRRDVLDAIECAVADPHNWRSRPRNERMKIFRTAAQNLRQRRADLIGALMLDGGKLISEADPEVSEAIDFTEFYPLTVEDAFDQAKAQDRCSMHPRGTVAVISPWNFPLAIPCGGIVSALAAGNTVILKPASDTVLPAWLLARCFWDAGVPETALQLVPCSGSDAGQLLVTDPRVDAVVLTGGTATAKQMLDARNDLHLIAETGGKNATIVTSQSDRDLAIKHVLHSAFGHSGQKCSATSLLLLAKDLYEDERFREALRDATESLPVGSAWDLTSRIGPLIRPPTGDLEQGLKELESGEEWLVMPKRVDDNPHLYRPGIKWNVQPGSFTHQTELFGPVLGVMPFGPLEQAIEIVNATGYGLTSGLESLDDREQELWRENIHAGNLYINRPTTGAIVLRQPFGGIGSSGYGPGAKAGGPHYVLPLMKIEPRAGSDRDSPALPPETGTALHDVRETLLALPDDPETPPTGQLCRASIERFACDAAQASRQVFSISHDHVGLVGQDNLRRYLPVRQLRIRLSGRESASDICIALLAAATANCHVTFSMPDHQLGAVPSTMLSTVPSTVPANLNLLDDVGTALQQKSQSTWRFEWLEESDDSLAADIEDGRVDRLRVFHTAGDLSEVIAAACRKAFVTVLAEPIIKDAQIECLRFLNEQSISYDYHRYGNLGRREMADN